MVIINDEGQIFLKIKELLWNHDKVKYFLYLIRYYDEEKTRFNFDYIIRVIYLK